MGVTINTPDATSTATTNKSLSKKEIRSKFLSDFKGRIDLQLDKLYLFYGRPYDFDSPNTGPLPEPIDSISDDASIRKAIMALKLIRPEDVTLAIRRIEWTSGTKFDQYSNLIDLEDKDYYAFVKSQNKLYICLDNNNGATSDTEPNRDSADPFTTADGYKWKLLIDYNSSVIRKFSATTHLPLPIKGSEQIKVSTTGGQIERLELTDDSPETIDYTDASPLLSEVPFFIKGDGDDVRTGRASFAGLQVNASTLVSATITEAGTGYYNDSTRGTVPVEFRLTDPSSANTESTPFKLAYGLATITNGTITALEVVNSGSGYPASGSLTIVQSSAIAYATLDGSGDRITSTVIEKPGANFRTATVVSIAGDAVSDTEDADSYIQPIISPFGGHGSNLQSELSATSLFLNIRVSSDTSEFTQTNDFRQIGIISNVKDTLGADIPDESIDATTSATLVAGAGMEFSSVSADAIIEGRDSLHTANIVDLNETSTTTTMRYLNSQEVPYGNTFNNNEVVDFDSATGNGFTISNITKPAIDIFSGDILFINNNTAIQRNAEQTETLNFIFNF